MEKRSKTTTSEASRGSLQKAQVLAETVGETARDDIVVKIEEPSLLAPVQSSGPPFTPASVKVEQPEVANIIPPADLGLDHPEPSSPLQLTQRQAIHEILDYLQEAATYQQKSEAEIEQRTQMLMHLAATGIAAERVAHEFGRQVNAALEALHVLRNRTSRESERAEAVRTLDACLGSLRNEFRVLAPYEAGWRLQRTAHVSADESVRLALKLNEQLINSADISVEIEGEDFDILARPASIVQIFDNLVHNACVWLDGWRSSRHLTITLNHVARTVAITDTGPGIPPHMREHIFKPFISLRNGGRGLGLYITHELLRAMQGSIQMDTEYNRGARFIMQFPALDKDRSVSGSRRLK